MFEIDKEKLGSFVAQLRKEKGLMQKELAEKLYISDKVTVKITGEKHKGSFSISW